MPRSTIDFKTGLPTQPPGRSLWTWIRCHLLGDHEWTSRAAQGGEPTQAELDRGMEGFREFSRMYCKTCGKNSRLNNRL